MFEAHTHTHPASHIHAIYIRAHLYISLAHTIRQISSNASSAGTESMRDVWASQYSRTK